MPDRRHTARVAAALALGMVLAALTGLGGVVAALAALLAQPALALAVSWQRGTRSPVQSPLLQDVLALLALWAVGFTASAVLLAWPLAALLQSRSLLAALAVSAVVGLLLIALWRTWPMWHALEREGGSLARRWAVLGERESHGWQGLGVAALVALAIGVEQALSDSPNWGMVAVMLIVAGIGFVSRDADVSSQQSGIRSEPSKEPTP